jgi:hypothetical protein
MPYAMAETQAPKHSMAFWERNARRDKDFLA